MSAHDKAKTENKNLVIFAEHFYRKICSFHEELPNSFVCKMAVQQAEFIVQSPNL
jgi:hypothetical protein